MILICCLLKQVLDDTPRHIRDTLYQNAVVHLIVANQPYKTYVKMLKAFNITSIKKLLPLHGTNSLARIDHWTGTQACSSL